MSKAAVFMANGTEECEALLVVDILRRAGVEVIVASASGTKSIITSHKIKMETDALAEELNPAELDLVVLPGGIPGTPNLEACPAVISCVRAMNDMGKKIAAVCAAPSILGHMGLLQGKNATAHANFRGELTGANVLDQEVVVDGNITTSFGLGGSIPFALELACQLAGKEASDKIRGAIEYLH